MNLILSFSRYDSVARVPFSPIDLLPIELKLPQNVTDRHISIFELVQVFVYK